MRFGVVLPTLTGDAARVLRVARRAEELGYDGVFVPDHLGSGAGPLPLEAFATLAAVAATTPRVRVGTLVARATLRPVAVLARMVAAVDAMSHGRLVLGIGAGDAWSAGEDAAAGLPSLDADARRAELPSIDHTRDLVPTPQCLRASARSGKGEQPLRERSNSEIFSLSQSLTPLRHLPDSPPAPTARATQLQQSPRCALNESELRERPKRGSIPVYRARMFHL